MPVSTPAGSFRSTVLPSLQRDALRRAGGGVDEADAQAILHGLPLALRLLRALTKAGPAAAPPAAEQPLEYVAEAAATAAAAHFIFETARSPAKAAATPAGAGAIAEGRGRIALIVYLPPVELGALVLVGQQVIGARDVAEALRRFGIILVAVGVQLLGELAIGGFDRGLVGRAGYAQQGIGIGHMVFVLRSVPSGNLLAQSQARRTSRQVCACRLDSAR